ncbi:MAG: adenylate/guanylate cyclase domain-containing protein [Granulosicoccus sp.]|nr:adenylate/guanylate cyclase domain-containing protein [Granulosicoccus sp.]
MSSEPRPLTILFADIGSSAALYERLGDASAHRLITESLHRMRAAVETHHGKVLRTVGDSVLASFEQGDQAFLGAQAIQRVHVGMPLSVRIGFHTGSVIPDGGDVYGHAVNIAARLASFARVDEIMATAAAVEQLSDEHKSAMSSVDMIDVRGLPAPLAVHRLQWQAQAGAVTRLSTRADFATAPPQDLRLRICHGDTILHAGLECCDLNLGRADDNDIAVHNDEASRHHARICFRHGQFLLQDESTNGTFVQKESLMPFLVRRDSIVLDGAGVISLGAEPQRGHAELIHFELLQD